MSQCVASYLSAVLVSRTSHKSSSPRHTRKRFKFKPRRNVITSTSVGSEFRFLFKVIKLMFLHLGVSNRRRRVIDEDYSPLSWVPPCQNILLSSLTVWHYVIHFSTAKEICKRNSGSKTILLSKWAQTPVRSVSINSRSSVLHHQIQSLSLVLHLLRTWHPGKQNSKY